jgi:hypothetical protein
VKRWTILVFLMMMLCGVGSCGSVNSESAFMTEFSICSVIEAKKTRCHKTVTRCFGTVTAPLYPDNVGVIR